MSSKQLIVVPSTTLLRIWGMIKRNRLRFRLELLALCAVYAWHSGTVPRRNNSFEPGSCLAARPDHILHTTPVIVPNKCLLCIVSYLSEPLARWLSFRSHAAATLCTAREHAVSSDHIHQLVRKYAYLLSAAAVRSLVRVEAIQSPDSVCCPACPQCTPFQLRRCIRVVVQAHFSF